MTAIKTSKDQSTPLGSEHGADQANQDLAGEADLATRLRAVVGRLSRHLRPTVAGSNLTPSQISVLFTIVRLGPLGLSELASIEGLNPTMLSRVTAQLGDAGLISRQASPDDRRAAIVSPTGRGRKLRERVNRERTTALETYLQRLDDSQLQALIAALPALEELAEIVREGRR